MFHFSTLRDKTRLVLGRVRNLAPHLSAIIQFPAGLSSREDKDDDDDERRESDTVSFHPSSASAKIVIRAGATNAFAHIK